MRYMALIAVNMPNSFPLFTPFLSAVNISITASSGVKLINKVVGSGKLW